MDATFTPFTPPAHQIDEIIDALGSPDNTLREVANEYQTTLEAITLWMTRPDIARRLDNIQSAVARRTRLIATNFLPGVTRLLNSIINQHLADEYEHEPQPLTAEPRRHRENARKAGLLLFRLAKFVESPARDHPDRPPQPTSPSRPSPNPPPTNPHLSPRLDASMPHALLPSADSPLPDTPPLRAAPSASLPYLVAQASGLSPSRATSASTAALPADASAILPNLPPHSPNACLSLASPQPPPQTPRFSTSNRPVPAPPNQASLHMYVDTPSPRCTLMGSGRGDSIFLLSRERHTPAPPPCSG